MLLPPYLQSWSACSTGHGMDQGKLRIQPRKVCCLHTQTGHSEGCNMEGGQHSGVGKRPEGHFSFQKGLGWPSLCTDTCHNRSQSPGASRPQCPYSNTEHSRRCWYSPVSLTLICELSLHCRFISACLVSAGSGFSGFQFFSPFQFGHLFFHLSILLGSLKVKVCPQTVWRQNLTPGPLLRPWRDRADSEDPGKVILMCRWQTGWELWQ
jgi:hypothetical protein